MARSQRLIITAEGLQAIADQLVISRSSMKPMAYEWLVRSLGFTLQRLGWEDRAQWLRWCRIE